MKITKLGHCCLVIDLKGKRIMTDPGSYTAEEQTKILNIDYVLYTHEHEDHFHLESLKKIIENNPEVKIYANTSVGDLLEKENIPYTLVEHKSIISLNEEITIEGIGEKHALLHSSIPQSDNTGFLIDKRLFYPGDALTNPDKEIDILALPIAGPWLKISEVLDYCIQVKPKKSFPVHDGIVVSHLASFMHSFIKNTLAKEGIEFIPMATGDMQEFY